MEIKRYINIVLSHASLRYKDGLQVFHQYQPNHQCVCPLPAFFPTTQTDTQIQREKETGRERGKTFPAADNQAAVAWCCIRNVFFHAWVYISGLTDSEALT